MIPLGLPNRQWLDANPGLKQDFVGEVVHGQFRRDEVFRSPVEQDGDIGIAIGLV